MGKRIYNFDEFVNESYMNEGFFSNLGSKISSWAKNLYNAVKSGIISIISSGPKAGTPRVGLFDDSKSETILEQVNSFYKGTPYYKMNNLQLTESYLLEAAVPLTYPVPDDVLDYSEEEIKNDIKRNMREIFRVADEMKAAEAAGASEDEIDDIYRGILDVKPIFIYGAPGIGKTQIVAQVCDELGKEMYGKKLTLVNVDGENAEPVDFAGVPSVVDIEAPSKENKLGVGLTRSNINADILPYDNGKNDLGGIIFIDELNRMPREVIKIFMKLAQSRRIGNNYKVPPRWYIVAAGNRKVDDPRGGIEELGTALRDRFEAVNFVPTVKGLRKYIESSRYKDVVLPELMDFLEFQTEFFHNLDPDLKKTKYPTPRAWVDGSNSLRRSIRELEAKGVTKIPLELIRKEFQKNVGKDAASAFVEYYRVAKDIPLRELDLVYSDPSRAPKPNKIPVAGGSEEDRAKERGRLDYNYALSTAAVRKSLEKTLTAKEVCNFTEWLAMNYDSEQAGGVLTYFANNNKYIMKDDDCVVCIGDLSRNWEIDLGISFT